MDAIGVAPADGTVLFAAGVFYYFTTKQVQRLITSMAKRFPDGPLHLQIVRMEFKEVSR